MNVWIKFHADPLLLGHFSLDQSGLKEHTKAATHTRLIVVVFWCRRTKYEPALRVPDLFTSLFRQKKGKNFI